jgi:hypothetical protein
MPRPTYGKSAAQLDREIAEALAANPSAARSSHAQKKTTALKDIEPGLRNVARRSVDAENRFLDYAMEHGRLSRGQAATALAAFRKARVIKFDAVNGTFHVTHGQFLDPDVLRRAAGIDEEMAGRRSHATKKPHVASPEGRFADLQRQGFMKRGAMRKWLVVMEAPSGDPTEATYLEVQGKTEAAALRAARERKPGVPAARFSIRSSF